MLYTFSRHSLTCAHLIFVTAVIKTSGSVEYFAIDWRTTGERLTLNHDVSQSEKIELTVLRAEEAAKRFYLTHHQ